jgi:hypothetical protein
MFAGSRLSEVAGLRPSMLLRIAVVAETVELKCQNARV